VKGPSHSIRASVGARARGAAARRCAAGERAPGRRPRAGICRLAPRRRPPSAVLAERRAGATARREFDLLLALAERPQRVLNRDQLLDLSRGRADASFERSVDVQISRLRRKLKV